uniref:Arb2 domain-containing protein n=1 Tax=Plectus sambesii TaxID=2011161 RepID=A0A914W5F6_9BILA
MVLFIGLPDLCDWRGRNCDRKVKDSNVGRMSDEARMSEAVKEDRSKVATSKQASAASGVHSASLEQFGYVWNESGQLRCKKTDAPYQFDAYNGDKAKNQERYEALGDLITEVIYDKLEAAGCKRIFVPVDASEDDPRGFFFATDDAWDNKVGLAVLIHGSGAVRAGQWARRLIINESLDAGSQLPYIDQFKRRGFGVVVLNTNLNRAPDSQGKLQYIEGNARPEEHGVYVWRHFIQKAKAPRIVVVAHSAGGCVAQTIARTFEDDFVERVAAVCLTDSMHSSPLDERTQSAWWKHMLNVSQNWVTSCRPVGAREKRRFGGVLCASAGTPTHEETSWKAMGSVFEFIDERTSKPVGNGSGRGASNDLPLKKARSEEETDESSNGVDASDDGFEVLGSTIADE